MKIKFAYVEPKLEEETTAIAGKKTQKFDGKNPKYADNFGGQAVRTTGRAIPSWRQGVS